MIRIFRASDHEFDNDAFHKHCDGKANTLTIIHNSHGKIFGGFSTIPWTSSNQMMSKAKSGCFISSVDMQQKFVPNNRG